MDEHGASGVPDGAGSAGPQGTSQDELTVADTGGVVRTALRPNSLGLVGVTMQAITHIAPAIAALFFTQFIVSLAGITAPLAYVVGVIVVLMLGNLVLGMFGVGHGEGMGLRSGGPLAIIFSLVCIGLAAFSFLIDFDAADQMIRAGAPEKAAWGIALGLTVTLVWLYIEILRLLSYLQND